jgi:hypothetical protein
VVSPLSSQIQLELEQHVKMRTGGRVRNLAIELDHHQVILHGQTSSYYVKQLAQHSVHGLLPHLLLANRIEVEERQE